MQTIIPHLWYDTEAKEAVAFYVELFGGKIDWTYTITDTPSGDSDLIQFQLGDMTLAAISAGPYFKLNESMSLMVNVASKDEVTRLYQALSEGGRILMPLGEYPFSPYYVWLETALVCLGNCLMHRTWTSLISLTSACSSRRNRLVWPSLCWITTRISCIKLVLVACLTMAKVRLRWRLPS